MALFTKTTVVPEVRPEVPVPVAAKPALTMSQTELKQYVEAATQAHCLGNGALLRERILHFCENEGICIYDMGRVEVYLDNKFGPPSPSSDRISWGWIPARPEDMNKLENNHGSNENGTIVKWTLYHKEIPLPVMITMGKLAEKFPGTHFFVADKIDERMRVNDPFLAIAASGMALIVVERWDEPGFRM